MSNFNKIGGRYGMHSGSAKFKNLQVDAGFSVQGNSFPTGPGSTFYVDSGVNANGNGSSWSLAFKTIQAAVDAASENGDTIYVAPGDYSIAVAIEIEKDNLRLIGPNKSCNDYAAMVYTSAADNLVEIDAHNVSIVGLGFSAAGGAGHGITFTGASYKCYIAQCRFDGWGNIGYGVKADDTSDSPDLVVEDCLFRSWATGGIYANTTRGLFRRNMIFVDAASIGINFAQTGGNRPDSMCYENYIIGSNSTDTGIQIAATEPTDGTLLVANNVVTNCSTNITQDKSDAGVVNNGTYGDGAAFVQVDPNA